jgi:hypothetical protein
MEEPTLIYVLCFSVVGGILAALLPAWVLHTRPWWWQVRLELYGLLCWAGAMGMFFTVLFAAFTAGPDWFWYPDWFWFLVGFAGYAFFCTCFLIHEKFAQSRI